MTDTDFYFFPPLEASELQTRQVSWTLFRV